MKRYLVLVHFASKFSRESDSVARMQSIMEAVRRSLDDCETAMTSEFGVAVCGLSARSATDLWTALQLPVFRQDNLSVIELGAAIATTHPGLAAWQARTAWLARTDSDRPM